MAWRFEEDAEDRMLRDTVRGLLSERGNAGRPGDGGEAAWRRMAELGWFALGLPEAAGGLGGSARQLLSVMEEAGRTLAPEPLLPNLLVAPRLLAGLADPHLRDALASGEARFALFGSNPRGPALRLSDADRIAGSSGITLGAAEATHWFVAVHGDEPDGAALLCLPRSEAVALRPVRLLDGRDGARLHFDDVPLRTGHRVAAGKLAADLIGEAEDRAAAGAVADGFGAVEAGFRLTLDYLKAREQFGRPLSSLQAVQHMAVDAFVGLEQLRSLLVLLHGTLDGPADARARAVSGAKSFLAGRGTATLEACIQLSGGIGVTADYDLGRFYKRVLTWNRLFGDADSHLGRIARCRAGATTTEAIE